MLRTLELQLQLQAIFDSIKLIEGNFVRRSKGLLWRESFPKGIPSGRIGIGLALETPSEMLLKYNFDSQCVTSVNKTINSNRVFWAMNCYACTKYEEYAESATPH